MAWRSAQIHSCASFHNLLLDSNFTDYHSSACLSLYMARHLRSVMVSALSPTEYPGTSAGGFSTGQLGAEVRERPGHKSGYDH
jgi:hypothetical protein